MAGTAIGAAIGLFSLHQANKNANKQRQIQQQALEEQRKSNEQAVARAKAENLRSEQEYNRANRQNVNVASALDASELSAKQGASGTLLTGTMGVDPSELNLSKNTLLGA
tara:strand:- start:1933 stop:2262 length:330 start_codon:yes stop_codon:yes gene_type:complete